ncbi:hypothetical protein PVA45_08345 (plasmid) [Entomospira entomophila]|uniref:Uncharacterized protein n=1 Tax=Entomospira entomophila TaxID=2719988 RepID=A0A968GAJ5_9SPIO|nr:hypothetical protein [Entomospira entomophilus]NIZ41532.1 hypothetical protein [Entomospira entomophilus]WDI36440.1 hypothetical protein PVA45_08345 [Entomospira entomophilus]
MSVYKKINRETGEEALRYIVYDGNIKLGNDLTAVLSMVMTDGEGVYQDMRVHVKSYADGVYITISDNDLKMIMFNAHVYDGNTLLVMHHKAYSAEYDFSCSRSYAPDELEALYPSSEYDTVEVE